MIKNKLLKIFGIFTVVALVVTLAIPTGVYASDTGEISTESVETLPENTTDNNVNLGNSNGGSSNSNGGTTSSNGNTSVGNTQSGTNGNGGTSVNLTPNPITENELVNTVINSDATINDLGDKIINKLYQGATLMQRAAVPIALIGFIAGAVLLLWGAFSKRATIMPGLFTLGAAILLYTLAVYAPNIVVWASKWLVE